MTSFDKKSHGYSSVPKERLGFQGEETHKPDVEKSYHIFRLHLKSENLGVRSSLHYFEVWTQPLHNSISQQHSENTVFVCPLLVSLF